MFTAEYAEHAEEESAKRDERKTDAERICEKFGCWIVYIVFACSLDWIAQSVTEEWRTDWVRHER
jgi:hypothetical protein